jgi:hypothetical protein
MFDEVGRQQLHSAFRATVSGVADDFWMHRAYEAGLGGRRSRQELHPALRTLARLLADHLGVHRACVDDSGPLGSAEIHFRDKGERLVRWSVEIRRDPLPLSSHFGVRPQRIKPVCEIGLD